MFSKKLWKLLSVHKCACSWMIILDDHWILTMVRTKSKIAWHFDRRVVLEGGEGCLSRGSQFAQLFCPFYLFCHCGHCECLPLSSCPHWKAAIFSNITLGLEIVMMVRLLNDIRLDLPLSRYNWENNVHHVFCHFQKKYAKKLSTLCLIHKVLWGCRKHKR